MAAYSGLGLGAPASRRSATFDSCMALSALPPMPTPTPVGGQGLPPALTTASTMKRFTPSRPSAGLSILSWLMFSEPAPFGITVMRSSSPATSEV